MTFLARIVPLVIAALLVAAADATAAEVSMERVVERDEGSTAVFGEVTFAASAGEVNTITVQYTEGGPGVSDAIVVSDTSAAVAAGDRCQQVDPHTVRCQDPQVRSIDGLTAKLGDRDDTAGVAGSGRVDSLSFEGGDGDDHLRGATPRRALGAYLEGGNGDDTLTGVRSGDTLDGGPGDDVIDGGRGNDYIAAGPGNDDLRGGTGNDYLYAGGSVDDPAPAGRDRLDGGAGRDTLSDQDDLGLSHEIGPDVVIGGPGRDEVLSYLLRPGPVRVDLTKREGNGAPGENDELETVEQVIGGTKADTLLGTGGANRIEGGDARDLIRGAGGDDELLGGKGRDRLEGGRGDDRMSGGRDANTYEGGAGDDRVSARNGVRDRIDCGAGRHDRAKVDRVDVVRRCETVRRKRG